MTNLEMLLLCAEAAGWQSIRVGSERGPDKKPFDTVWVARDSVHDHLIFDPLGGLMADVACMALIKRFHRGSYT